MIALHVNGLRDRLKYRIVWFWLEHSARELVESFIPLVLLGFYLDVLSPNPPLPRQIPIGFSCVGSSLGKPMAPEILKY